MYTLNAANHGITTLFIPHQENKQPVYSNNSNSNRITDRNTYCYIVNETLLAVSQLMRPPTTSTT